MSDIIVDIEDEIARFLKDAKSEQADFVILMIPSKGAVATVLSTIEPDIAESVIVQFVASMAMGTGCADVMWPTGTLQ